MALSTKGLEGPNELSLGGGDITKYGPNGGATLHAPLWEVGNPVAVALSGLQSKLDHFAQSYDDVQINNALLEAKQDFEERYNNPETGIFHTRQRDKAAGVFNEYRDYMSDYSDNILSNKLNERQLRKSNVAFANLFIHQGHQVGTFETKELMNAQVDSAHNAVFKATETVTNGDLSEDTLGFTWNSISQAYDSLGKMQGWNAETTNNQKREAFGDAVIKGATAKAATDPIAAAGALSAYREFMPIAKYQAALGVLDPKIRDFKKQHYLELMESDMPEEAEKFLKENAAPETVNQGAARGIRNNNPGNIVKTSDSWGGEISGADEKFKSFSTPEHGIAAIGRNLQAYASKGINTVSSIIEKWAPPKENDTVAYINSVAKELGVSPDAKINVKDPAVMSALTKAIIKYENGSVPYSEEQIKSGIDAALGKKTLASAESEDTLSGALYADAGTTATDAGGGFGKSWYQPGIGMLKPSEVRLLQKQGKQILSNQRAENATQVLSGMPYSEQLATLNSQDGRAKLGLDVGEAKKVAESLHALHNYQKEAEKEAREQTTTDIFTKAVQMADGGSGPNGEKVESDPVASIQYVRQQAALGNLDGKHALEIESAIREKRIGKSDPAFVSDLNSSIAKGETITDNDLVQAYATGKLSEHDMKSVKEFREFAAGPAGALVKDAFKALDNAFAKSMLADGTPEQALARFAAQQELLYVVDEGKKKGNIQDLLNPDSKNFVLPGIIARNTLSMEEQMQATMNRIKADHTSAAALKTSQQADKGEPQTAKAPQRSPGESPEEYLKRIGAAQ